MLEFSSQIGSRPIDIQDYMDYTLPYVGGFQYQYNSEKYGEFMARIALYNAENRWTTKPPDADLAVFLPSSEVYHWMESYRAGWFLNAFSIPYDVIYDATSVFDYSKIYIPLNLTGDVWEQGILESYISYGGRILNSLYQLGPNPFPAIDFEKEDPVHAYWISGSDKGSLTMSRDMTRVYEGYYSERWEYTLPASPSGNYPMFDMKPPHRDCSGLQSIGIWFYFNLSGSKTGNLVKLELLRSGLSTLDLGYWVAPSGGIAPDTWVYHEWPLPEEAHLDEMTYLRMYYHAGDGWSVLAQDGKIVIYMDNILFTFEEGLTVGSLWTVY